MDPKGLCSQRPLQTTRPKGVLIREKREQAERGHNDHEHEPPNRELLRAGRLRSKFPISVMHPMLLFLHYLLLAARGMIPSVDQEGVMGFW